MPQFRQDATATHEEPRRKPRRPILNSPRAAKPSSGIDFVGSQVDDGVAAFACRLEDAQCSQAVGHPLGEPALDCGCLGELGGVEEFGQAGREQTRGLVRAADADPLLDRDKSTAGHDPSVPAIRLPVSVDAELVLVGKQQLEFELRVAEQRGDADEPVEDVLRPSAARCATCRQQLALVREPDDPANERQRCDKAHPMLPCEQFELASQRCEAAGLDLDQQVAADEIDDETVDDPFDAIVGALVPVLELRVQRTLVERSDRGDLNFWGSGDLEDGAHDDAPFCAAAQLPSAGHRPAGLLTQFAGTATGCLRPACEA